MGLPKPVTRKSSKKDLWEELEAARSEIDAQQRYINGIKNENYTLRSKLTLKEHQIKAIQHTLSLSVIPLKINET